MNEEEKQAIDWLKNELDDEKKSCKNCNYSYKGVTGLYGNNEVEIALKLIEKQQKEIENYISKDKIKEKIKELESHIWKDGYMTKFDKYAIHYLKELLGE